MTVTLCGLGSAVTALRSERNQTEFDHYHDADDADDDDADDDDDDERNLDDHRHNDADVLKYQHALLTNS